MNALRWQVDEFGTLNLRFHTPQGLPVHAWIACRNSYCDRGHFEFNVSGPFDLDAHDSFPRFYFVLETAIAEAELFLQWRIHKTSAAPRGRAFLAGLNNRPVRHFNP